ncbi:hypothetical protein HZA55_02780, partial [Candidatus Poribacteria bacterium]|nr:hypothetical protein [Candidatus Poribacteria bacterium]
FTNDKTAEGTHKIRKTKYEVVVSAKGFIKNYKLDKIKNNIIVCELDKKENILAGKY